MATPDTSILDLDRSVRRLLGQFCWEVEWSNLGNLSMQFGKPRTVLLREPIKSKSRNKKVRWQQSRRMVAVCGDWKLWIHVAHWRIVRFGKCLATGSSSYRKKYSAMQELHGQRLLGIHVNRRTGASRCEFDLDTVLEVRRMDRCSSDELWVLYGPDGYERSVRGNGTFGREWCGPLIDLAAAVADVVPKGKKRG